MDKRSSSRYEILLDALVHPKTGRTWRCAIQDFCANGMLLVEPRARERSGVSPGIEAGVVVGIHFAIPGKTKDLHFRLEGCIVRVMDTGVGIKFEGGLSEDVLTGLMEHASSQVKALIAPNPSLTNHAESPQPAIKPAGAAVSRSAAMAQRQSAPGSSSTVARPANIPEAARLNGEQKTRATDGQQSSAAKIPSLAVRPPGAITEAESRQLVLAIRRVMAKVLPKMHSAFFAYMDEGLLIMARDAKSNTLQAEYFEAMSILEKAKEGVGEAFIHAVLDQFDNPRRLKDLREERNQTDLARKRSQASNTKLSLVDTDDFEDWLAIANIISRSERAYGNYLQEFRARLGMVVASWGHKEAIPLGCTTVCHAFDQAIQPLELNKEIRQKVYVGFEAKVVPWLKPLYLAVSKILADSQLFLNIDEVMPALPAVKVSVAAESPSETKSMPSPGRDEPAEAQSKPLEAGLVSGQQGASVARPPSTAQTGSLDLSVAHEVRADLEALRSEIRSQREQITVDPNVAAAAQDQRVAGERRQEHRSEDSRALGDIYQAMRSLVNAPNQLRMWPLTMLRAARTKSARRKYNSCYVR